MCFSVQVDVNIKKLAREFGASLDGEFEADKLVYKPLGPSKSDRLPVVVKNGEGLSVKNMIWSLTPNWSKEYPCKWSTYNARMERSNQGKNQRIYDVPTFKNAFRSNRFCLVPIHAAIESCYWGETAGKIIAFKRKDNENYFVVGLWDEWTNKNSGEVFETCTLLTDGPYRYFFERGHDRSVISIDESKASELLLDTKRDYKKNFDFLKSIRINHDWSYDIERELKDGWEKRAPKEDEIYEIEKSVWRK